MKKPQAAQFLVQENNSLSWKLSCVSWVTLDPIQNHLSPWFAWWLINPRYCCSSKYGWQGNDKNFEPKFILQLNLYGPSVLLVKKQLLFALDLDKQTCWKKLETRELHGVVVIWIGGPFSIGFLYVPIKLIHHIPGYLP